MQRKHLKIIKVVALVGFAIWSVEFISPRHYRLPDPGPAPSGESAAVHMVNGLKIGEATSDSAIIWTRLTRDPETEVDTGWGRLVTGVSGEVRVLYWPDGNEAARRETDWVAVHEDGDFTRQIKLSGLDAATNYSVVVEGRPPGNQDLISRHDGRFRTAPMVGEAAGVRFTVLTCMSFHRIDDGANGNKIFPVMESMDIDFLVHTGDIVYYDKAKPYATDLSLARFKWNRMFALPNHRSFFDNTGGYFMKDDHDTLKNDAWPGQWYGGLTWEQGLATFREQVPMSEKTYRTFRWGKHLQFWLIEGRDFRSPNTMPDGPDKTIWGEEQKEWFFETVQASDATYKLVISPTPIVGPDRDDKYDNHTNQSFRTEGEELRAFLSSIDNLFVITGDRHWQYVSEDPETGLIEFASGPTTDRQASGFSLEERQPMHKYLNIKGGFLSVEVTPVDEDPEIIFTHHGVDGSVYNQVAFRLE